MFLLRTLLLFLCTTSLFIATANAQAIDSIVFHQQAKSLLDGSIGDGMLVKMNIQIKRNQISGIYYYKKYQEAIAIRGHIKKHNNDISTFELREYGNDSAEVTGIFIGHISTNNMGEYVWEGTWQSGDGSIAYPFQLKEFNRYYIGHQYFSNKMMLADHDFQLITREGGNIFISDPWCHQASASYCQIGGLQDTSVQNKVNRFLKNRFASEEKILKYRNVSEYFNACMVELDETNHQIYDKIYTQNYETKWFTPKLLSVGFYVSEFLGGAHDSEQNTYATLDLRTGEMLQLTDLFKKETNFLEYIAVYCQKELLDQDVLMVNDESQSPNDEVYRKATVASLDNFEHFYLTSSGLTIVFPYYQLERSWAERINEEVTISYNDLQVYLKNDFQP
ncbi:MAG: PdaC/SigV domain-containing protein [Chitinophagales bacterium]